MCGNLPVLAECSAPVLANALRPASDSEALARALIRGETIDESKVVGEQSQQQSCVDARRVVEEKDDKPESEKSKDKKESPKKPEDVPIPDDIFDEPDEGTWEIPDEVLVEMGLLDGPVNEHHVQEGLDEESGEDFDVLTELQSSSHRTRRAESSSARNIRARLEPERNVRPRTGEPESERGESLPQSRRESV